MPLVEGISVDADPQTCGRHHGTVALAGSGVARVGVLCHQIARVRAKLAPGVAATGPWEAREQLTEVCHHDRHRAQQETACDRGRLEATQCPQDRAGHGALKSSSAAVSWPRDSMSQLQWRLTQVLALTVSFVAVKLQTSARKAGKPAQRPRTLPSTCVKPDKAKQGQARPSQAKAASQQRNADSDGESASRRRADGKLTGQ